MKVALLSSLLMFQVSCGVSVARSHIDEYLDGSDLRSNNVGSAFHTSTGWTEPTDFYVDSAASDQIIEASELAALSWNDSIGYDILSFAGLVESNRGESLYSSLDDDLVVVYTEDQWSTTTGKSSSTLATTVWENALDSDAIVKSDIILNTENYHYQNSTDMAETLEKEVVDTETILVHEFGHLLGLDHVSVEQDDLSVMNPKTYIGLNVYSRELSEGDISNIQTLYP